MEKRMIAMPAVRVLKMFIESDPRTCQKETNVKRYLGYDGGAIVEYINSNLKSITISPFAIQGLLHTKLT